MTGHPLLLLGMLQLLLQIHLQPNKTALAHLLHPSEEMLQSIPTSLAALPASITLGNATSYWSSSMVAAQQLPIQWQLSMQQENG